MCSYAYNRMCQFVRLRASPKHQSTRTKGEFDGEAVFSAVERLWPFPGTLPHKNLDSPFVLLCSRRSAAYYILIKRDHALLQTVTLCYFTIRLRYGLRLVGTSVPGHTRFSAFGPRSHRAEIWVALTQHGTPEYRSHNGEGVQVNLATFFDIVGACLVHA